MKINSEIDKYYKIFKGLPSDNPIVRNGEKDDAFEVVVYNLLFRKNKRKDLEKTDLEELKESIISPPDNGIDIFYEDISGDDFIYNIVQVKNSDLDPASIKECFATMRRTIGSFLDEKMSISKNARELISKTNLDDKDEKNLKYYVVHSGNTNSVSDLKENEFIVGKDEILTLLDSVKEFNVPKHTFKINGIKDYLEYKNQKNSERKSIICTINASEIADLAENYLNTDLGRNILFGQNLREALAKGSKTYSGMKNTIIEEPENFWYYNNGITIVAKKLEYNEKEIKLKNFSIINGAQTSSSFVQFKKEINSNSSKTEKAKFLKQFKKVKVLTRIVETKDDEHFQRSITLYNNTQNPISTRDMVSNNIEQRKLQEKFLANKPEIFIEIRRGETKPETISFSKHRTITNTEIAQFIYAGILTNPFNAKDKKTKIFNKDNTASTDINSFYDKIFSIDKGVAHKLTNNELDELLFIKELHKKSKKVISDKYNSDIKSLTERLEDENENTEELENDIRSYIKLKQINNINTFYNIALYYHFKISYDKTYKASNKTFKFDLFYDKKDKKYQKELVNNFASLFNQFTNKIIKTLAFDDPAKFVRAKPSEKIFIDKMKNMLQDDFELKDKYKAFINEYKK